MFKKILQSLSKSQSAKTSAVVPPKPSAPMLSVSAPIAGSSLTPAAGLPPKKPSGVLDKVMKGAPPATSFIGGGFTQVAAPGPSAPQTPEELCEIAPKTPKDQVQARLKLLYRRYNHSASSLDPKIRSEAEKMLTAIVHVREQYFGRI